MTDPRREHGGGTVKPSDGPNKPPGEQDDSRTAGTNRDFDDTKQSDNQGHGHPREERGQDR